MLRKRIQDDPETEARITQLLAQRMKHWKKVVLIDLEVNRLILNGGLSPEERKIVSASIESSCNGVEKNEKTLDFYVYDMLLESPMTLKDLVAEILRTGYKTRSKNFSTVVQQVIHRLSKASAIKRDSTTREYSSIKLSPNILKQRLTQQSKNRRKARSDKMES